MTFYQAPQPQLSIKWISFPMESGEFKFWWPVPRVFWDWASLERGTWHPCDARRPAWYCYYFGCRLVERWGEFSLVPFSRSVVSDSLWPHGLKHARLPCPSSTPKVHTNPCPLSQWCHPTISSSVICFSSCPQSFPASGSFLMSQLFASGGQSIGASASASVLPMSIQGWFPLGLTGLISLLSKGLSRVFFSTTTKFRHKNSCRSHIPCFQLLLTHPQFNQELEINTAVKLLTKLWPC